MTLAKQKAELKHQINLARASVKKISKKLKDDKFKLEDIKVYNTETCKLGILQTKLKFLQRTTKAEQYLEEIRLPNNINL